MRGCVGDGWMRPMAAGEDGEVGSGGMGNRYITPSFFMGMCGWCKVGVRCGACLRGSKTLKK
jgi:hypothetical protein